MSLLSWQAMVAVFGASSQDSFTAVLAFVCTFYLLLLSINTKHQVVFTRLAMMRCRNCAFSQCVFFFPRRCRPIASLAGVITLTRQALGNDIASFN